MIRHGTRLAAQTDFYGHQTNFYLADYDRGTQRMAKIEYEEVVNGAYCDPSFRLTMDAAQEFFEMLWAQGFRSKHDRGGADKLDAARTEHIADLRRAAKLDREKAA